MTMTTPEITVTREGRRSYLLSRRLEARFPTADLEWRALRAGIANGKPWVQIAPYISARAVYQRLDEVLGLDGWELTYRRQEIAASGGTMIDGMIAVLRIRVGEQWVTREDGAAVGAATSAHGEEMAYKGVMSSAIKRVAVTVGIGRYLYSLPPTFGAIVEKGGTKQRISAKGQPDQWVCWMPPLDALRQLAPEGETELLEALDEMPETQPQRQQAAVALHNDQLQQAAAARHMTAPPGGAIPSACPACGGPVWDNREGKRNPKAPDWRCRNEECRDSRGYVTAGWVPTAEPYWATAAAAGAAAAAVTAPLAVSQFDELPEALDEEGVDDDLPF